MWILYVTISMLILSIVALIRSFYIIIRKHRKIKFDVILLLIISFFTIIVLSYFFISKL